MNNSLTRSKYAEESPYLNESSSVILLNPLSNDLNVMRQTLLFGGLETIAFNQNRKSSDLKLFEFGRTYRLSDGAGSADEALKGYNEHEHLAIWITGKREPESWRTGTEKSDLFDLKVAVHAILTKLGFDPANIEKHNFSDALYEEGMIYSLNKTELLRFGILRRKELKRFDLKQDVMFADFEWERVIRSLSGNLVEYREIPKFPEVRRDLALVLDPHVTYEDLEKAAFQAERKILRSVSLFDIYMGDKIAAGKKSYALSFLLRDDEKTLTDQVIEKTMSRILKAFEDNFQATLR
jgi:phenylalanyl-tRNA synthetase beta chain